MLGREHGLIALGNGWLKLRFMGADRPSRATELVSVGFSNTKPPPGSGLPEVVASEPVVRLPRPPARIRLLELSDVRRGMELAGRMGASGVRIKFRMGPPSVCMFEGIKAGKVLAQPRRLGRVETNSELCDCEALVDLTFLALGIRDSERVILTITEEFVWIDCANPSGPTRTVLLRAECLPLGSTPMQLGKAEKRLRQHLPPRKTTRKAISHA